MASTPNGNSKTFLDIPTPKGLKTAFVVIVVFMVLADGLYCLAGRKPNDDVAKVADTLIQGAIISILFAFLKAMIDKSPGGGSSCLGAVPTASSSTHQQHHQDHQRHQHHHHAKILRDCVRQRVP